MLTPALVARPGDSGPAARVLLEALIARELLDDSASNRTRAYGSDDDQQVRSIQEANGLEIDGIVGPKTWGNLLSSVEPGTQSPMVRVLQTTLIVRHLIRDSEANLDGDYGTLTQARVREFQATSGIDPIATVGPQTWTALLGVKNRVAVSTRDLGVDEDADVDLDDLDLVAIFDEMHAS
jgi:peptidoglycan hydrolase-like protein with peptidoglycan-binding domain